MLKRRVLAIAASGSLGLFALVPAVAHAGSSTDPSHACTDQLQGNEIQIPIVTSPVTLAVEIFTPPGKEQVLVCYSTTPDNTTGPEAAGGFVGVQALSSPNA